MDQPKPDAAALLLSRPVATLATVRPDGRPHVVPVTFAMPDPTAIVFAVDHKPKRTNRLQRLANIAANPAVSFLVDEYDADWSRLWWVRADADASIVEPTSKQGVAAIEALVARYRQYVDRPPAGPVVWCRVTGWAAWSASG